MDCHKYKIYTEQIDKIFPDSTVYGLLLKTRSFVTVYYISTDVKQNAWHW